MEAGKLTTAQVTYAPFLEYIVEQGAVMPLTTYYLDAVEGGRVLEVCVEQGTHVEEGKPVLRLSNANLQFEAGMAFPEGMPEGLEEGETVITSMYENFGDMERLVLKLRESEVENMATLDQALADPAHRTIRRFDGRIVTDAAAWKDS